MGRGLRACCFAAAPSDTLSFKEAAAVAQALAGAAESEDVLDLLPEGAPDKGAVAAGGPSKAAPYHECAEERIPAGYTAAAAAAVPAEEEQASDEPAEEPAAEEPAAVPAEDEPAAEPGLAAGEPADEEPANEEPAVEPASEEPSAEPHDGAEEPAPAAATEPAAPEGRQAAAVEDSEDASLEAAVAAALGLAAPAFQTTSQAAAPGGTSGARSAALASPRARCSSVAHLALELQLAEALGDLEAAAGLGPTASAGGASPGPLSPGGGLLRSGSGASATKLSSPWRTSTSSFGSEAEASKRFSCCGSTSPALETIRESLNTHEPSAAPACSDSGCEATVAALLGCTGGAVAEGPQAQHGLDDILSLLGEAAPPSEAAAGGKPHPLPAGPEGGSPAMDAIEQLLHAGSSSEPEAAAPVPAALAAWAPAPGIAVGRLASISLGSEAGREGEAPGAISDRPVVPEAHGGPGWEEACGGASAPAKDASGCCSIHSSAAPASGAAGRVSASLPGASPRLAAAGSPRGRAAPCWSSDGEAGSQGLAAMHDRGLLQRREAEQRYAQLRQQQEAAELSACTFRPKLLTGSRGPSRPGSAPIGGAAPFAGPAAAAGGFGQAAGSAMYARQQAQRQRQLERQAVQRAEQEREALSGCTFRPAVDDRSQRMFIRGLRYGGSGQAVGGPPSSAASLDEEVRRQLELLHSAGLNAAAAAAVLAGQGAGGPGGAEREVPGEAQPGGTESQPASGPPGQLGELAGAAIPAALQGGPSSPPRRPPSGSVAPAGLLLSPGVSGRPLSASARLYAHAINLQERQRQAAALQEQAQRAEMLAASPKAKPFPRAQHTNPPSPPLSRRSPPTSRPGSAPPPGLVCASLEHAAAVTAALPAPRPAAGQALERSSSVRAATYWQRWGLEPGSDFDGFLQRQEKFAQALGAKLEAERQHAPAQAPDMSPGSRRLLERRQQLELAQEMEAAGCRHGTEAAMGASSRLAPPGSYAKQGGLPRAGSGAPGPAFPFRPAITARAAAKPGRTAEELHAEAARCQEKLAQRRREAEQAALAHCTFAPDIAPAGGSPLARKFAGGAKGRINMQDLDGYMREVRKKQAAREGAAAAAARAREERELASCTFHPSLGHQRRPSPTKAGGPGEAPAAGSCVPAINSARPPDVLAQVEALLHGEQPVGSDVEHGAQGEPAAGRGSGQATTGGAGGAAAGGFSAFLGHVTAELRRMQAE